MSIYRVYDFFKPIVDVDIYHFNGDIINCKATDKEIIEFAKNKYENFKYYFNILYKNKKGYFKSNIFTITIKNSSCYYHILCINVNHLGEIYILDTPIGCLIENYIKQLDCNMYYLDFISLEKNSNYSYNLSDSLKDFIMFSLGNVLIDEINSEDFYYCPEEKLLKNEIIKVYKPKIENKLFTLIKYLEYNTNVILEHNTIILKEYKFVKENTDILIYKDDELVYKTDNNLKDYKIISDLYIDLFYGFYKKYKIDTLLLLRVFGVDNLNNNIAEYFFKAEKKKVKLKTPYIFKDWNSYERWGDYVEEVIFYDTDLYYFVTILYKQEFKLNLYEEDKQIGNLYNVLYTEKTEKFDFNIFTDSIYIFNNEAKYLF